MKGKSIAVQILTTVLLLLGANIFGFTGVAAAWAGIASMALTLVLSTFAPSGTFVKGWSVVMWATNIGGIIIQLLSAMSDQSLVAANITNGIIIVINIILQVYFTDKVNPSVKVS